MQPSPGREGQGTETRGERRDAVSRGSTGLVGVPTCPARLPHPAAARQLHLLTHLPRRAYMCVMVQLEYSTAELMRLCV